MYIIIIYIIYKNTYNTNITSYLAVGHAEQPLRILTCGLRRRPPGAEQTSVSPK